MADGASPGDLSYDCAGGTEPAKASWTTTAPGFRRHESTVLLGFGDAVWAHAGDEVLSWGIKRRSGFRVTPATSVTEGSVYRITAGYGPFTVHEPVRVIAVVEEPERRGFAYGTLWGHPVSGEEAFIVHRNADGAVSLTLRSLTRAASRGFWRHGFPALLLAQRFSAAATSAP